MDPTGCPDSYARDNTLNYGRLNFNLTSTNCDVPIPFYLFYMSVCTFIILLVAIGKTLLVRKTQKQLKKNKRQYSTFKAFLSYLSACRQFLAFFSCLILTFAPFIENVSISTRVIPFFLGLQMSCFVLAAERWLAKLVRLGKKIIPKDYRLQAESSSAAAAAAQKQQHQPTNSGTGTTTTGGVFASSSGSNGSDIDLLQRSDTLLIVLDVLSWICMLTIFVTLCITIQILPNERISLNIGVSALGVAVFTTSCGINWQYQRCILFLKKSHETLKQINNGANSNRSSLLGVTKMFKTQQKLIFLYGALGTIVYLLYGTEIIPMNWTLLVVTHTFDAIIQGTILFTFLRGKKNNNSQRPRSSKWNKNPFLFGTTTARSGATQNNRTANMEGPATSYNQKSILAGSVVVHQNYEQESNLGS